MFQYRLSIVFIFLLGLTVLQSADIPQIISYQGQITDIGGTPIPDGTYNMRFRIFDAATGGNEEWDSGVRSVTVSNGVFTVLLGESPMPAIDLPFNENYWLLVTFDGINQTPRQRLASTGYSFMASGLVPGTQVVGAISSGTLSAIKGVNTTNTGITMGLYGETNSVDGYGVYGFANATTGDNYGGYFKSNGRTGVYGAGTYGGEFFGLYRGIYGEASGSTGSGVYGKTLSTAGQVNGIRGFTSSNAGRGVSGYASSTSGVTYGILGEVESPDGFGVYAKNSAGLAGGFEGGIRVDGMVHSTAGGFKFPNGSIQTIAGLVRVFMEEEGYLIPPNSSYTGATCDCPTGSVVVGGGWESVRNEQPDTHDHEVHVYYNRPLYAQGWVVGIRNDSSYYHYLTVYAICASTEE